MKRILIIDDSPTDILLFKEAILECGLDVIPTIVRSWAEVDADGGCLDRVSLILLDLNMPGVDGLKVIRLIRGRDIYTPIVVFSTSSLSPDILACYREGANAYIIKPYEVDKLFYTVCSTFKWWLELNKLGGVHD